jgi:hypothetical protein
VQQEKRQITGGQVKVEESLFLFLFITFGTIIVTAILHFKPENF